MRCTRKSDRLLSTFVIFVLHCILLFRALFVKFLCRMLSSLEHLKRPWARQDPGQEVGLSGLSTRRWVAGARWHDLGSVTLNQQRLLHIDASLFFRLDSFGCLSDFLSRYQWMILRFRDALSRGFVAALIVMVINLFVFGLWHLIYCSSFIIMLGCCHGLWFRDGFWRR